MTLLEKKISPVDAQLLDGMRRDIEMLCAAVDRNDAKAYFGAPGVAKIILCILQGRKYDGRFGPNGEGFPSFGYTWCKSNMPLDWVTRHLAGYRL